MLVFLDRTQVSDQGSLELRQKPVRCSCRVKAMNIGFAVQNVDVLWVEASLKECLNRGMRAGRIGDCADNAVGRIAWSLGLRLRLGHKDRIPPSPPS